MKILIFLSFLFSVMAQANNLNETLVKIEQLSNSKSSRSLRRNLNAIETSLKNLNFGDANLQDVAQGDTLKRILEARFKLQDRLKREGWMPPETEQAARGALRAMRAAHEQLNFCRDGRQATKTKKFPFAGGTEALFTPPGQDKITDFSKLPDGAVISMSGGSGVSRTITRITDGKSNFSHQGIVSLGENGKKMICETLIETGPICTDIQEWADEHGGLTRFQVFKPNVKSDGKRAAKRAYSIYKEHRALKSAGKKSPYSYGFGKDAMYCSDYIGRSYQDPKRGGKSISDRASIPTYPNGFKNSQNPNIVHGRLGFPRDMPFAAPGDMELQKGFTLMGEYHNPDAVNTAYLNDAFFDKVLDWMNQDPSLDLSEPTRAKVADYLKNNAPQWLKDRLEKHFELSTNLPDTAVGTMMTLDQIRKEAEKMAKDYVNGKMKEANGRNGRGRQVLNFAKRTWNFAGESRKFVCQNPVNHDDIQKSIESKKNHLIEDSGLFRRIDTKDDQRGKS